jgi:rhamnose transport system substrate-binding protein
MEETPLKHTSAGRLVALIGGAALALSACSTGGGATTAPSVAAPSVAASVAAPSEAASAPASAPASAAAGEGISVGYLPKDIVNQYFAAAKTGIDKAAGETGGTVTQVGPNEAKADLQIPFITDLTTKGVDAIIISADGKDEVAPALKAAMDAGIKVVGFDSSPAVGAYNVFVNQADFSGVGDSLVEWTCEIVPDCTGDFAILSAAATATNQNAWIDGMKAKLASDPKYAGLKLVDTVYGDDDATKSTTQAQALLTKYPNLKAIVAPTTVGVLAAAQVVSQAGKSDSIKVTGLGFPNDMKPFVHDGTSPVFGLWSVPDLGYLSYVVADKLVKGEITGAEGETFTVPSLNNGEPYTIGKDSTVTLGPAFRFDETNVDQFNF